MRECSGEEEFEKQDQGRYDARMEKHQWQDDSGEFAILYRAEHFGGNWTFSSQEQVGGRGDDKADWIRLEEPVDMEHLHKLRAVLWNKYQRKRCPWKLIDKLDKVIAKREEEE